MAPAETREPNRTFLLYCPYDKRVTRHGRRGKDLKMICLDCGRGVDSSEPTPSRPATSRLPPESAPTDGGDFAGLTVSEPHPAPARSVRQRETRAALERVARRTTRYGDGAQPGSRERLLRQPVADFTGEGKQRTGSRSRFSIPFPRALLALGGFLLVLAVASVVGNFGNEEDGAPALAPGAGAPGLVGHVANTEGIGVFVRRSPEIEDRLEHAIPEGSAVRVLGPETWVNGLSWRQVEDASGVRGWVPARYVRVEAAAPSS